MSVAAGRGERGMVTGPRGKNELRGPCGVFALNDGSGTVIVADTFAHAWRKLDTKSGTNQTSLPTSHLSLSDSDLS